MHHRSQATSPTPRLRNAASLPDLGVAPGNVEPQIDDRFEALREAKKQVIAWRDLVHDRLRGPQPPAPCLAVRVGSNEFAGDGEGSDTSRSRLYQTRDLWTLLTLTNPDQELVIVHETLDPDILYYYLRLGVAEGRPSLLNRLGRLRAVLLPAHRGPAYPPDPYASPDARAHQAHHNLAVRLLGHVSCQKAVTSQVKHHVGAGDKILSLYQNSPRMEAIAKLLQIDALTTPVPLLWLGSKHGSRQVFQEAGIPHPLGIAEPVYGLEGVAEALCMLTRRAPFVDKWVVKITDGTASGNGNAVLDVSRERRPFLSAAVTAACLQTGLKTQMNRARFMRELKERGAIIEAFVAAPSGARVTSPSAQGIIDADGTVHVISSHEQVLDQATGQSFEGCRYPAIAAYRADLLRYTRAVGHKLYTRGARGHFAVDYLAVENKKLPSGWRLDAIEINLRETGTTPPFMMMQLLCGGRADEHGAWRDAAGRAKFYVASDNIYQPNLKGVHPQTVIDAVSAAGLEFTAAVGAGRPAMTGVVLTLLPGIRAEGKVGCICIADGEAEASAMRQTLERCLAEVREAPPLLSAASGPRAHGLPSPPSERGLRRRSQDFRAAGLEARYAPAEN